MKKIFIFLTCILSFTIFTKPALLIIDMQPYWMDRGVMIPRNSDVTKIDELLKHQGEMIEESKKHNIPILVVEFESFGETIPFLSDRLVGYLKTKKIRKNSDGLFDINNKSRQEVFDVLRNWDVDELIIIGANGGACIEATVLGALESGYRSLAYPKGIADFNYPNIMYPYHWSMEKDSAEKELLREYYNNGSYSEIEDVSEISSLVLSSI